MTVETAQFGVQLWHLLIALGGAISLTLMIYMRLRQLSNESQESLRRQIEDAKEEAIRRKDLEGRVVALEKWTENHRETCSREHDAIRVEIKTQGDRISERLHGIEERLNTLSIEQAHTRGALDARTQESRSD